MEFPIAWSLLQNYCDAVFMEKAPLPTSSLLHDLKNQFTSDQQVWWEALWIRLLLACGAWTEAKNIFNSYGQETLQNETHPLFVAYGCFLCHECGQEVGMQHFSDLSTTVFPPTTALLGHYLLGRDPTKIAPFLWQRKELLRQIALFYLCAENRQRATIWAKKKPNSRVHIPPYSQN